MTLDWKPSAATPRVKWANAGGLHYTVDGAARSYTARVYRLSATEAIGRILLAYDDDSAAKCRDWCQRFADERATARAKAKKLGKHRPVARLPRGRSYRTVLRASANVG